MLFREPCWSRLYPLRMRVTHWQVFDQQGLAEVYIFQEQSEIIPDIQYIKKIKENNNNF